MLSFCFLILFSFFSSILTFLNSSCTSTHKEKCPIGLGRGRNFLRVAGLIQLINLSSCLLGPTTPLRKFGSTRILPFEFIPVELSFFLVAFPPIDLLMAWGSADPFSGPGGFLDTF